MAIAHVQGASHVQGGPGNNSVSVTLNGITAGDCLIVSVGFYCFLPLAKGPPLLGDSLSNAWLMAGTSQATVDSGITNYEIYTYVAQNSPAGDTNITFSLVNDGGGPLTITVDEYSGVASIQAIDAVTFNATVPNGGLTTIASGNITVASGELLYSSGYAANLASATFTATAGFTQRQLVNSLGSSLASFDQLSTGGSYSNTISVSGGTPNTLHVLLLSLSPTPISRRIVQWAASSNSSITTESTAATFPYHNTAGNLLVAFGNFSERTGPVFSDTQGNTWHLLYGGSGSPTGTYAVAYCLGCAGGANTVTLNTTGGGDDNSFDLLVAEYSAPGSIFTASSYGNTSGSPASSVNTGNVSVGSVPALLISGVRGDVRSANIAYPPFSNLETTRFQYSDSGLLDSQPISLAIADVIENAPGNYNNVFTPTPVSGPMEAVILGFTLPPLSLTCASGTGQVGVFYTSALIASGGTPPYTFAIIAGSLPPGLNLNTSTGVISGIPVTVGTYAYTAQVTDSLANTATASCSITIGTKGACGAMPTLELTRDLDANWGDSSTFFITQDEPLPFTLRGIVLRLSYNQD